MQRACERAFAGPAQTKGDRPNGYQAGISDVGNHDQIVNNKICGNEFGEPGHMAVMLVLAPADCTSPPR